MAAQYTVPIAIDPSGFLTGLDQMEEGLVSITTKAKGASTAIGEAMTASNKAGDQLVAKMNQGAQAAKNLSDASKAAGVDLNKAFENVKGVDNFTTKVSTFVSKVRDISGKPIDFKFNFDQGKIAALTQQLKGVTSQMEGFEIIMKAARAGLNDFVKGSEPFNILSKQIDEADKFLNVFKEDLENIPTIPEIVPPDAVEKTQTLKSQLREMKEELAALELAGKGGSKEFVELAVRAGELSDQIGDTNQQIKALASDTKGLDAGITAIRGLAGAFAVGQGALAAFGESSEEAAQAIQKVQGALAILQGVQEVANVLNKDSTLMVYLQTFARKANTTAIVAETVALEAETVATAGATTATNAFTAALLANPITAIVAAVALLAVGLYALSEAYDETGMSADQFNKFLDTQNDLLEADLTRVKNRTTIREAELSAERRNQSELLQVRINALQQEKIYNQIAFEEKSRSRSQLNTEDKNYKESLEKLNKDLEAIDKRREQINVETNAAEILLKKQKQEEDIKLSIDFLKNKQSLIDAENAIQAAGLNYLNEIRNANIAQLKDGQEKELAVLRQGLKEKVEGIDAEGKANLLKLNNLKKELELQFILADENGKKVISNQISNLNRQIELEKKNGAVRLELVTSLTEAELAEEMKIREKYIQIREDIEFQVATTMLGIQKESAEQKNAILELSAQHEISLIEKTNQDKELKNLQINAIEKKLQVDKAANNLDFRLKEIETEKIANENLLMEQKGFFDKSRDAQAFGQLLLAKNQLEADEKKLKALKDAGVKQGDQEYENAKNAVIRSKAGVDQAIKESKPQSIFELLFPGDDAGQKNAENFMMALGEVGKAVDAYTNMQIANYQRMIAAQKEVVQNNEDQINDLKDRLKEEQALRDEGFANNVDGIRSLLEEKNKQRDEDLKKADEYQKKMEKIQKAQVTAQTALQAAQMVTAATNIYLQATAAGGPAGAIIGGIAVAAMIAAFITGKKAAYDAVNTNISSFGGGGIIKGKSHAQGGQRYYAPDGTGDIMELEEGEHVTSRKQTEKYLPLLEAVNHDKLKDMDDSMIVKLLDGLGVHLNTDKQHKEALKESREHTSHQINQISIEASPKTPKELVNIDHTLTQMANRNNEQVVTYEENGYIITKKGSHIKQVRKR